MFKIKRLADKQEYVGCHFRKALTDNYFKILRYNSQKKLYVRSYDTSVVEEKMNQEHWSYYTAEEIAENIKNGSWILVKDRGKDEPNHK